MNWSSHNHDGVRLAVAEDGTGQPFYFQHGLCGSADQVQEVFPVGTGYRMVTLECRGHGRSPPGNPVGYSIASFASDVASLIRARDSEAVVLGGISMGSAIGLRIAVFQPNLVRALVLARPAWLLDPAPSNLLAYARVGELLRRFPPSSALEQFGQSAIAASLAIDAPDNLASLRSFFSRKPEDDTAELLCRISLDGPGITESQLSTLDIPTLVIGHGHDVAHPLMTAKALSDMIPHSRFVEITAKGSDRARYVSEFRSALRSFLEELS